MCAACQSITTAAWPAAARRLPVINEAQNLPGFILAAGFSGHGFGIGPGAGRLIAELATGTTPFVDHTQYTLARLNKGVWGKVSEF
ncbi:FAD-dependent oxidoreductase [Pseudomonas putida]|uniref:FAD-dependent oxidoreductase n=1 Tax=Pseudomonas putida TaxID=303 RepID=UPI003905B04E